MLTTAMLRWITGLLGALGALGAMGALAVREARA